MYNDEALSNFITLVLLKRPVDALNLACEKEERREPLTDPERRRAQAAAGFLASERGRYFLDHFVDSDVALAALEIEQ